jgi:NAD(P)H-dependent flavin oxidoreductase YrpB (nitropropane dioxygenase family)
MSNKIFNSKYPILEACMNKGSTLPLALAVHNAGAYPSLCSWTYDNNHRLMRNDLKNFVKNTNSNNVHISFELSELEEYNAECMSMIKDFNIPTMEIIFHKAIHLSENELTSKAQALLGPIKDLGTKIFRRILFPITEEQRQKYFLDGFCVKGHDAAGGSSLGDNSPTTQELFIQQQKLTPDALVIPYGGVGSAEQVKNYFDLGASIVAVGTVLAASAESPIKTETKLAMVNASKSDLQKFIYNYKTEYKMNALPFETYTQQDNSNRTASLVSGLYKKNTKQGHVYAGHSIDYITEILPCKTIVENLCKLVA